MSALLKSLGLGHVAVKKLPKPKPVQRNHVAADVLESALRALLTEKFTPCVSLTKAQRDLIMTYEQHFANGETNPKWLNARTHLATGSKLAGMVGWSPYEDAASTLMNMLWSLFRGSAATRFGTHNEPNAHRATELWFESLNGTINPHNPNEMQVHSHVTEVGLVRSVVFPFCGMSPDGVLTRTFKNIETGDIRTQRQLLEFKCPYRHRNVTDHWPAYDLYGKKPIPHIPGNPMNRTRQPVPQYYYTQLMWGGLLLGSHSLSSILQHPEVPAPLLNEYMKNVPDCDTGADLIDAEHPILFIVWANCEDVRDLVYDPECYYQDEASQFIRTSSGAFQLTEVDYNHEFAVWMMETVYDFWRNKYLPRHIQKEHGMLLKGELDIPCDIDEDM